MERLKGTPKPFDIRAPLPHKGWPMIRYAASMIMMIPGQGLGKA